MTENEKAAPSEPTAIGSEQSSTHNNIIADPDGKVKWLSDEKKINEPLFCECFCVNRELRYSGGHFCSVDGAVNQEQIRAEISRTLMENGITSGVAKKTNSLFDALKLFCHSEPITPRMDEIHVLNGVIKVDGREGEPPTFVPGKRFCVNRLNISYDPDIWEHQYYPGKFMDFLCGLLDFKDIQTLQEYLGYCLIPSTKAQKALFIIGNGGEGKSRIGAVLNEIFGLSMITGDFQRVENDKFFRYNLQNKLIMNDDDMQMTALKSTGIIKNIITAEIPIDVEAKGQQSSPALLYSRFICFGNGSPKNLYDKTKGWSRRLLILTTKPKPANRVDNPFLAENFIKEKEQMFCWMLDGLRRLIKNGYKFTESEKTRGNIAEALADNCNIIEFLKEAVIFDKNKTVSSKQLHEFYANWCEENGLTAMKRDSFVGWLKSNEGEYPMHYSNNVYINKKRVWGFEGISIET